MKDNIHTLGLPTNCSALFGHGLNPCDARLDPHPGFDDGRGALPTGGSSSGAGTAASLWAASVGTETSGSILSPALQTGLVGIKPTLGRISRHGIIPITADQDTAGPMARTVTDAAIRWVNSNVRRPTRTTPPRSAAPCRRSTTTGPSCAATRGAARASAARGPSSANVSPHRARATRAAA